MKKLTLTLETVTPLFLGGAEARGEPELRPASFRGGLRFWWRALWGGAHPKLSEDELYASESEIFGNTEGASPIVVRLSNPPRKIESWKFKQRLGVDYMFFSLQGRKEPDRKGFSADQRFKLILNTRPGASQNHSDKAYLHACAALWLFVMLGGTGARSRRGAGNLRVVGVAGDWPEELPPLQIQTSSAGYYAREISGGLAKIYKALDITPSPISKIAEYSLLHPDYGPVYVLQKEWDSWETALDEVGNSYLKFRSRRFPDYQNVKDVVSGNSTNMAPVERAAFGLPIVYYYRSLGGQSGTLEGRNSDRRASALIFHVAKLASGKYTVGFVWFRARLLPRGSGLMLKRRGRPVFGNAPSDNSIAEFLQAIGIPGHVDKQGKLSVAPLLEVQYPSMEKTE